MGNIILRCLKAVCDDTTPASPPHQPSAASRPQFASPAAAGLAALGHHLLNFETTSQVPEGLSQYVSVSKKTQAKWYAKILATWKESNPPPRTPEEAASLVARALQVQGDVLAGFLQFYSLPFPQIQTQVSGPSSWPEGVQFELHTLPVDAKLVGDGDGMTVHVNTADPRESSVVPIEVHEAVIERRQARAVKDYTRADALQKLIKDAGYRVHDKEEILAREYRIRLRGIDAPEMNMEYGQESKDALTKLIQGKPLTIHVYEEDGYGRLVGDVYCNGVFVQEKLLRKGCAWHYEKFDNRPSFAQWHREAQNAGRGLWAYPNPVAPWTFKWEERNKKNGHKPYQNRRNAQRDQRVPIPAY
ncbi:Ca(2+)-dependent nuclease family protein [Rhynchospora pubera]|uniref:Ca(2+)-dependent nuclease family protein n=1 Tax=Rhynchospora pubera TaxID=906938 RepID=A0AAV8ENW8_9POAL|nr:Ca(2+)-dependent nuclease family protein [Rhynchospora pubera]